MHFQKSLSNNGKFSVNDSSKSLHFELPTVTIHEKKNIGGEQFSSSSSQCIFEHGRLNQSAESTVTSNSGFINDTRSKRKGNEIFQSSPEKRNLISEFDNVYEYQSFMKDQEEKGIVWKYLIYFEYFMLSNIFLTLNVTFLCRCSAFRCGK